MPAWAPPGPPAAPPPATSGRKPLTVALLSAGVAALVVALIVGTIAFVVRSSSSESAITTCGIGHCFRNLDQTRIERDLGTRGFTCADEVYRQCKMETEFRRYSVSFATALGSTTDIRSVTASLWVTSDFKAGSPDANYFVWVVDQVVVADSGELERVDNWVRERVTSRAAGKTTVNGFLIEFSFLVDSSWDLTIRPEKF